MMIMVIIKYTIARTADLSLGRLRKKATRSGQHNVNDCTQQAQKEYKWRHDSVQKNGKSIHHCQ